MTDLLKLVILVLAIAFVQNAISKLGGSIQLDSEEEQWPEFRVSIPNQYAPERAITGAERSAKHLQGPPIRFLHTLENSGSNQEKRCLAFLPTFAKCELPQY